MTIGWTGVRMWLAPLESMTERIVATLVFTDIVDSTATAVRGPSRTADRASAQRGSGSARQTTAASTNRWGSKGARNRPVWRR